MKKIFILLTTMSAILIFSCKKTDIQKPPASVPPSSANLLITPVGVADGSPVSKSISAATGGSLTSGDGRITITIPAGAFASDQTVSIQPIINTTGFGIGKAYRLLPHGITFNKAVKIAFKYTDADLSGTQAELLGIGYQDNNGAWQSLKNIELNKQTRLVSATTDHFSDWGFFPLIYIDPSEARVGVNEIVNLRVMYAIREEDEDWPLPSPAYIPMRQPFEVSPQYIKKWTLAGTGVLTPNESKAVYKAPAQVPSQNPEAVNAEIDFPKKGKFSLVANITILSDFHIDYMQVDETEVNVPQQNIDYVSRLLIYGNFGPDPGAAKRSVKVAGINLGVMVWSSRMLICEISSMGAGSSGEVVVNVEGKTCSKLLNEWTHEFNYEKKESPDGSLTRKVKFVLRFRGDAIGFGSGETAPLLPYTDLNKASKAIIKMVSGVYSNPVTEDGCGTFTVNWGAINDYITDRSLYSTHGDFSGRVYQNATGFGVKIKFTSADILRSTRMFTSCTGAFTQQIVSEPIYFEGFHEQTIWFPFTLQAARSSIKAGSTPIQTGTSVAPGLYWDASDLHMDQFSIKTFWGETMPKYN